MRPDNLKESHELAIRGAYAGRGILAPGAAGQKQIACWFLCITVLLIMGLMAVALWFPGSSWASWVVAVGAVGLGWWAGDQLFHANFIVDRSLTDWRRDSI